MDYNPPQPKLKAQLMDYNPPQRTLKALLMDYNPPQRMHLESPHVEDHCPS